MFRNPDQQNAQDQFTLDNINTRDIQDGDDLINVNSFAYLAKIAERLAVTDLNFPYLNEVKKKCGTDENGKAAYGPNYPYGDLYTNFLLELEKNIQQILNQIHELELEQLKIKVSKVNEQIFTIEDCYHAARIDEIERDREIDKIKTDSGLKDLETKSNALRAVIIDIFENPNEALERSTKFATKIEAPHTSPSLKRKIREGLQRKNGSRINIITPAEVDSTWSTLKKYVAFNLKPQSVSSLPSIRKYNHQQTADPKTTLAAPKEIRFGTQGQYHHFHSRISPLFEAYAELKKPPIQDDGNQKIAHVYFNNLPTYSKFGKSKLETRLTKRLHEFEGRHPHFAVVTLPAKGKFLNVSKLKEHKPLPDNKYVEKRQEIIDILVDPKVGAKHDFKMSDDIRSLIGLKMGQGELSKKHSGLPYNANDPAIIRAEALLDESIRALGFTTNKSLSEAQLSAVYFHLNKYILPDLILTKTNADSFNIACFDAIDRGGATSAYYNLLKSIEKGVPMSKDEFIRALHGAPIMVKGRGMNHQTKLLWNAIDAYVDANMEDLKDNDNINWLIRWRDENTPKESEKYKDPYYKLLIYIKEISSRDTDYHRLLSKYAGGVHKKDKKVAAEKILPFINNIRNGIQNPKLHLMPADRKALYSSELGQIYSELQKTYPDYNLPSLKPSATGHINATRRRKA